MSIRAMQAVFDHSKAQGNDRLVLLAIADASDHDGTGCYRGKERLATMACCERTTVTRAIGRLEGIGELTVDRTKGRSNRYRIVLPGLGDPVQSAPTAVDDPVHDEHATRCTEAPTPGAPVHRDPFSHPSKDPESAAPTASGPRETSIALLAPWWESFTPRPTQNYVGAVKIIEAMLKAGWSAEQLRDALGDVVPPLTTGALEVKLRRRFGSGRQRRDDPSGLR